jgi:hypothetical protein
VGYKFNIGKGWKLEPRIGLYLAYGIGGETKGKISSSSGNADTFDDEFLSPLDVGLLGGFFFDNNTIVIGLHSENGFTETNGDNFTVTGATAHTRTLSITLGYLF